MERKRALNISLWIIALLIINIIWANVASNEASQQLNDRGYEFQPEREVSIQPVFGSDAELPISITTEFIHQDDPTRVESVSWKLLDESNNVVLDWAGSTNEVVTLDATLAPGQYTLNTSAGENIVAIQHLDIAPFAPIAVAGHAILSLLLVFVAFGETGVRALIAKRTEQNESKDSTPAEFRKSRIGMPEMDTVDEVNESPWRDPVTR